MFQMLARRRHIGRDHLEVDRVVGRIRLRQTVLQMRLIGDDLLYRGLAYLSDLCTHVFRIGKLGDEDDLRVIMKGTKNLEMNKTGTHFEDELPLKTKGGKTIGAIGVVFNYKPGDNKVALDKIATEIQKEMQAQITSSKTLFGPAR